MKKIVALLNFLLAALIALVSNSNSVDYCFSSAKILSSDDELTVFELDCLNYGIEIDDGWDIFPNPNSSRTFRKVSDSFYDSGEEQYRTDIYHCVLRYQNTSLYSYLCRIVLTPIWKTRDWGFLGIGSRWDDWFFRGIRLYCDLPSDYTLGAWSPQSEEIETTYSYGVSISNDGFDISASMSVTNGLDITSATNAATNHFEIKYWYKNGENDYNHNSIVYYAMFNFICDEGGEELGISPTRFPLITFETTYHGFYYFMGHTRKFYARPFTTRPNDFDVPTT